MSLAKGTKLDGYEILASIGFGGMGEVYRARDTQLGRDIAIKVLPPEFASRPEPLSRFEMEARLASSLNHPNIITIYAIGHDRGISYIAMELVDGQTLHELSTAGAIPLEKAVNIALQIAQGLAKAHGADIVHRDLKPRNVMVTKDGFVKILDWGLGKLSASPVISADASTVAGPATLPGTILGTVEYMSPEQAGGRTVDFRSDQFSFGSLLYEMLTEKPPFRRNSAVQTLSAIIEHEPRPVSAINPHVPQALENVIGRCLAKNPADRYSSTHDLVRELENLRAQLSQSGADRLSIPHLPRVPRYAVWLLRLAAAAVLIAILGLFAAPVRERVATWLALSPIPSDKQLAILPFINIGADPATQPFCDGLVEVLASKLTQLQQFYSGLSVIPVSEIRREQIGSAREASTRFGATLAVTGSVQRNADKVRLTVNLIDARTLRQLKALSIDTAVQDVSIMQDDVVVQVVELLGLELSDNARQSLLAGGTTQPNAYDYYVQGRGYLQRYETLENVDAAIRLFQRAVERDPQYALAYAALGEAHWREYELTKDMSWIQEARKDCENALRLNDRIAAVHVTLALIDAGTGQYEDAIQKLKRAIAVDPVNADAQRELAKNHEALTKFEEAEAAYKRAIELRPNFWSSYDALGGFYFRRARFPDAEVQYQRVIELTPDNARAHRNLGAIYFSQERYEDAEVMFEKSAALDPADNIAPSNLATLYFTLGRYSDAARAFERAVQLNDRNYKIWLNLADAYYWAPNERDKARAAYERAAELAEQEYGLNPRRAGLLVDLADCYSMMGKPDRARNFLRQALRLASGEAAVLYRAGLIYEQMGNRTRALQLLDQAFSKGYPRDIAERSPVLEQLRNDPRYQALRNR